MGTRPIIYKYPLDLTGENPNNLVMGEPHELEAGENRAVVPNYGAYFAESVKVRDPSTGKILKPREDFQAVQLYQEATQKTGKEVCAAIIVTNPDVGSNVELSYQAIGGEFSYSVKAIRELLEGLDLDARPVRWGDILGKPKNFPPAPHLHDAGDLYGFEYLVESIESLRQAIMVGQEAALQELRQHVELVRQEMNDKFKDEQQLRALFDQWYEEKEGEKIIAQHLNAPNPHETNPKHIELGNLEGSDGLLSLSDTLDNLD